MSKPSGSCSSALLLSVAVTMLGAAMIRMAESSRVSFSLGLLVLLMGIAATAVSLLRAGRSREVAREVPGVIPDRAPTAPRPEPREAAAHPERSTTSARLAWLTASFESWWIAHQDDETLWPAFDRWVRDALHESGLSRLRCLRVDKPEHRLISLADEQEESPARRAAWDKLFEHVLASGEVHTDFSGEPDDARPAGAPATAAPCWLVPVRYRQHTIGLIVAGGFTDTGVRDADFTNCLARLLQFMWQHVRMQVDLRLALRTDRASGLLNRTDLTARADKVMADAAIDGEPVVVLAVAIEGLRTLDDHKQWELQDWLMHQVGGVMRRRLRTDDIVGRFSDDRFVAVLRRLDIGLGELIARKILDSVREAMGADGTNLPATVAVRCGLAADSHCTFESLLGRASDALQQARDGRRELVSQPPAGHQVFAGALA